MKILITGATSGIGYEFTKLFLKKDNTLILVSRNKEKLQEIQKKYEKKVKIIVADLSNTMQVKDLYVLCKKENIDILINNAGFGDCGNFYETDLKKELEMIDVNIKAVHILTKLFLKDMIKRNSGYILNVSSMASFSPGPLMATYYSTKSYVTKLTLSLNEELRRMNSNVVISCLCPGPVDTNFNKVANVTFSVKQMKSKEVAEYAVKKLFEKKAIIIPGKLMKTVYLLTKFSPISICNRIAYKIQKRKLYK